MVEREKKSLVEAARALARQHEEEGRPFSVVMLVPSSSTTQQSLWVSAPWMNQQSPGKVIHDVMNEVVTIAGSSSGAFATMENVAPVHTEDPRIQDLLRQPSSRAYDVRDEEGLVRRAEVVAAHPARQHKYQGVPWFYTFIAGGPWDDPSRRCYIQSTPAVEGMQGSDPAEHPPCRHRQVPPPMKKDSHHVQSGHAHDEGRDHSHDGAVDPP